MTELRITDANQQASIEVSLFVNDGASNDDERSWGGVDVWHDTGRVHGGAELVAIHGHADRECAAGGFAWAMFSGWSGTGTDTGTEIALHAFDGDAELLVQSGVATRARDSDRAVVRLYAQHLEQFGDDQATPKPSAEITVELDGEAQKSLVTYAED